jgi:hypothetical protein
MEPIAPIRPETNNKEAKHELTIAMSLAIASIVKMKDIRITKCEVEGYRKKEAVIHIEFAPDADAWEEYEKLEEIYNKEKAEWETVEAMEKYGITREEYKQAEENWDNHRRETSYNSPDRQPFEYFLKQISGYMEA